MNSIGPSFIRCCLGLLYFQKCLASRRDEALPACNPNQVCQTVNMISGAIFADPQMCNCRGCKSYWDDKDGLALTWEHYNNANWMIQYRFCYDVWHERMCGTNDDIVAVVTDDNGKWNPKLDTMDCRCPQGFYYMKSWELVGENWMYYYTCRKRPQCDLVEACVTFYLDYWSSDTTGYTFHCTCPRGFKCPGQVRDEWDKRGNDPSVDPVKPDGQDQSGEYYMKGHCYDPIDNYQTKTTTPFWK